MRNRKGFTLIELMIVVAIIGILATLTVPLYQKLIAKARRSEMKYNLEAIYKAQVSYYGEYDRFSDDFAVLRWRPDGTIYYFTFSLGTGVLGKDNTLNPMPPAATPFANDNAFSAYAWGSVDSDPTVDVWHMDDTKSLVNDVDDINL